MIPVSNEVHLAHLDQFYRRQRNLSVMGFVYADPAIPGLGLAGQESPVKSR
jgi:hypothetical protein